MRHETSGVHHARTLIAAVILTVALIGGASCSSDDDGDPSPSTTTASDPTRTTTAATPAATSETSPATVAATTSLPDPDAGRPSEPLASRAGNHPFVELRVTDLRRVETTVTLEFEIDVADTEEGNYLVFDLFTSPEDRFARDDFRAGDQRRLQLSGVTLVDQRNRKRHLVLRDERGLCLCSAWSGTSAQRGSTNRFFAQFPAPPASVSQMSVQVPQFPSIDSVPLRDVAQGFVSRAGIQNDSPYIIDVEGSVLDLDATIADLATATRRTTTDRQDDRIVTVTLDASVFFDTDSDVLRPAARATLDDVADQIRSSGARRVDIGGHTDSRNTDVYNLALSERRAGAVRDFLASRLGDGVRLDAAGFGESRPVAPNETPEGDPYVEGMALNRRVEIAYLAPVAR
jgi:outer membrane protein OmpA-like peptidoglycan-associated protein